MRGPKKHLKRLNAPSKWMLDKLGGVYAPRPSSGPHKLSECLPLILILRNRLRYALTGREVTKILMERLVKIDKKVRTDSKFPAGFMDVIEMEKTGDRFRMLYDTKGRFVLQRIDEKEAQFKLCKIKRSAVGANSVPYVVTHDGRTLRFAHPDIKASDTIKLNLDTNEVEDHIHFEAGTQVMVTGGHNIGRIGTVIKREKHHGGFDMVYVQDAKKHTFATRQTNVFVIGRGGKEAPLISLPKAAGIRLSVIEEAEVRKRRQK